MRAEIIANQKVQNSIRYMCNIQFHEIDHSETGRYNKKFRVFFHPVWYNIHPLMVCYYWQSQW